MQNIVRRQQKRDSNIVALEPEPTSSSLGLKVTTFLFQTALISTKNVNLHFLPQASEQKISKCWYIISNVFERTPKKLRFWMVFTKLHLAVVVLASGAALHPWFALCRSIPRDAEVIRTPRDVMRCLSHTIPVAIIYWRHVTWLDDWVTSSGNLLLSGFRDANVSQGQLWHNTVKPTEHTASS